MQRKALWVSAVLVLLVAVTASQAQQPLEDYLDVYTVHVKPDKRADFDAINKKMVVANRQSSGDTWLAMETVYGPGDRVTFVSTRQSYGEIEKGMGAFSGALEKTYGKAAADKMLQDYSQCIMGSRSEIRRRRWDLSSNAPSNAADYAKLIAGTRWLRTTAVHVRPGQTAAFEAILKDLKTAREKTSAPMTILISQAVAGQEGTVFYVTSLANSMATFDGLPTVQQSLGDWGYEKFLKGSAETVAESETMINRFLPELSNAPEQVAQNAPDFWVPKMEAPVNAKATPIKKSVVNASESSKTSDKH